MDSKKKPNYQAAASKRPNPGYKRQEGKEPAPKKQLVGNLRGPIGDEDAPDMEDEVDLSDEDVFMDDQDMKEIEDTVLTMEAFQNTLGKWRRPELDTFSTSSSSSIAFQQLDIDYVVGDSSALVPHKVRAAILRVFGVTEAGHSVCAFVHGFDPYFYIRAPVGCGASDLEEFHKSLEAAVKPIVKPPNEIPKVVTRVELLTNQTIMYYQREPNARFIKITLALPAMVSSCRTLLEKGFGWGRFPGTPAITYESNVLFALRFMIDCGISGGNWMELPAGKYTVSQKPITSCQLELHVHYRDLVSHVPAGQWSKMAPFRILSFDIECCGRKGHFPEPDKDPVIQIANMVTLQGESEPMVKNVMTLGSCSPIVGAVVMSFETEKELLLAWRDFIYTVDPDVIIGYNICKFDLPYLIERAEELKLHQFTYLGRIRNSKLRMRDQKFSSRQYGTRESKEITIEGRVQFDLLQAIQRDHKLSSYSLNSVSAHFLSEQKEDVHHSIIADLHGGTAETRRRLAVYCLKDAYLPQRLLDKLKYIFNYVEMARVTGVPLSFLLSRGQSIKVLSQILRKARERKLLVPNLKVQGNTSETYEGATVSLGPGH